jgi:hypothetical protein
MTRCCCPQSVAASTPRRQCNDVKQESEGFIGKRIRDFGCDAGSFLKQARRQAREVIGVALQDDCHAWLNKEGILWVPDLTAIEGEADTFFPFPMFGTLACPDTVFCRDQGEIASGWQRPDRHRGAARKRFSYQYARIVRVH